MRSVALYLEDEGDGARWCEALERCARVGVGVAVLKAGATAAGAAAAEAHTGAVAGDQRAFRALVEEAGGAWARDPHELLELAKAMATPRRRAPAPGVAVMTCSGGDSSVAADLAGEVGVPLAELSRHTIARLEELLPTAATAGNPLDYTSLLWGEASAVDALIRALADDPAVGHVLCCYDEPFGMDPEAAAQWAAVLEGVRAAVEYDVDASVLVASTLPELLADESAAALIRDGVPAVAGLETGLRVLRALARSAPDPDRIARIARPATLDGDGRWLAEHEAKALLAEAGIAVPAGRLARNPGDAARAFEELGGGPVALKLTGADVRHKTETGAVVLGVETAADTGAAYARLRELEDADAGTLVLVERMAPAGIELLVAARADTVVPVLVVGVGGIWTRSSTTSPSCRCRSPPSASRPPCAACAPRRCSPAGVVACPPTSPPPRSSPPRRASCCCATASSCSSSTP